MKYNFDILLIRGSPGIGKSTLGELLRPSLIDGVVIDVDQIRSFINNEKFIFGINEDYFNAINATCRIVKTFLELSYSPIVVIDVFSDEALEIFVSFFNDNQIKSITLFTNENVLIERMSQRTNGYINIEAAMFVNKHILESGYSTDLFLDTSMMEPRTVLKNVLGFLNLHNK